MFRWRRTVRALALAVGVWTGGAACGGEPAPSSSTRRTDEANPEIRTGTTATPSATAPPLASSSAAPSSPPPAVVAPVSIPFMRWLTHHCYIDELGPSPYTEVWRRYATEPEDDDALPVVESGLPPPGGAEADAKAAALEKAWLAEPQSHVVDCTFRVPLRQCARCTGEKSWEAHYVAYLPRALFVHPGRVRKLLILVPGGNGGRSRPFLSPLPGKTVFQRGSGGLRTKQLTDAWKKNHPDRAAPVVIALDSWGHEYNNGPIEYLSYEVPHHVAKRYLGGIDPDELTIGAEGISSGSRMILETLREKPDAFHTAGLTCLSCGRLNPDNPAGVGRDALRDLAEALAERRRAGRFALRFAIGTRDGQLPCNRALYSMFGDAGVVDPEAPPTYSACAAGAKADPDRCDTVRHGLATYAGEMHHYGLLIKSHAPQIAWQLDTLDRLSRAR